MNSLETNEKQKQELLEKKTSRNYRNKKYNDKKKIAGRLNNIMEMTRDRISELEDRIVEFIQSEQQRKHRLKKYEQSLRYLQDNNKRFNTCMIGVLNEES